jgi:hypothetical protein
MHDADPLKRKLACAAARYVAGAYEYSGSILPEEFSKLMLTDEYLGSCRSLDDVPKSQQVADKGNIAVAFRGAQLYLSSNMSVRFNLNSDFTGSVTIAGKTYNVTAGKAGDLDYIQVAIEVCDFYRGALEITGLSDSSEEIVGKYSLLSYIKGVENVDPELSEMLAALYAYCYEADVYYNGGVIPPYIDHTPPIDAELR